MPAKIVLLEIVEGPVLYTIISIHQQTSVPPPNSLTSFYLLKYLQAQYCSVPDPLSRHAMKHPYILSQLFPRFQLLFPGQADKSQISQQSGKGAQWRCRLSQTWEVGLHLPRPEKMTYDSCDNQQSTNVYKCSWVFCTSIRRWHFLCRQAYGALLDSEIPRLKCSTHRKISKAPYFFVN